MPNAVNNFLNNVAGAFFGNDYLRDYTHASKTFRSDNYAYAPKFKYLFHVYFDVNTNAFQQASTLESNFGILVKSVKLPNFTFDRHELNQYNRKRIVQTKIKYDPVDITFHDDNNNLINSLWYRYYTYYYADGTKPKVVFAGKRGGNPASQSGGGGAQVAAAAANYNARTQYVPSITGDDTWGYIGETSVPSGPNPVKLPFFKNITIFGLNRHNFIAYTLINPIITRFGHDTYDYEQSSGIMQNSMTIEYETVVYNQGNIDGQKPGDIVSGFGDQQNYDRKASPIMLPGSNSNVLGKNGLIDSVGGAITDLAGGKLLSGLATAGRIYNSAKNFNLKSSLKSELKSAMNNALQDSQNITRQKLADIPIYGQPPSTQGTTGSQTVAQQNPTDTGNTSTAGTQNNVNGKP